MKSASFGRLEGDLFARRAAQPAALRSVTVARVRVLRLSWKMRKLRRAACTLRRTLPLAGAPAMDNRSVVVADRGLASVERHLVRSRAGDSRQQEEDQARQDGECHRTQQRAVRNVTNLLGRTGLVSLTRSS